MMTGGDGGFLKICVYSIPNRKTAWIQVSDPFFFLEFFLSQANFRLRLGLVVFGARWFGFLKSPLALESQVITEGLESLSFSLKLT